MAEPQLSEEQQDIRRYLRRWLPILGIVLVLLGGFLSAFLVPDVVEAAGGPQKLTLTQAAEIANTERIYAHIEGGAWECDTLRQVQGVSASSLRYGNLHPKVRYSEVFFTDEARNVVMFVTLSGEVNCEELIGQGTTGYLYAMDSDTQQRLTNNARLARYFSAQTFLEFCAYCGYDNSMIGAAFGIIFLLSGVVMITEGRKIK